MLWEYHTNAGCDEMRWEFSKIYFTKTKEHSDLKLITLGGDIKKSILTQFCTSMWAPFMAFICQNATQFLTWPSLSVNYKIPYNISYLCFKISKVPNGGVKYVWIMMEPQENKSSVLDLESTAAKTCPAPTPPSNFANMLTVALQVAISGVNVTSSTNYEKHELFFQ